MTAPVELSQASLDKIHAARQVITPGYDRTLTRVGIVHFGVGGFHRSGAWSRSDSLARR